MLLQNKNFYLLIKWNEILNLDLKNLKVLRRNTNLIIEFRINSKMFK
jgi:hypothetical protein